MTTPDDGSPGISSSAPELMSAVRWHGRGDVRLDHVPVPSPSEGEVLIQIEMCGLCGTDFSEVSTGPIEIPVLEENVLTGRRAPIILGHEVIGTVVQIGPNTTGPVTGARVVPDVVMGCGRCWWCRRHQEGLCQTHAVRGLHTDGGLAGFMIAAAATTVSIDPAVPPEIAVLAEPMSVAVRALRKAGDLTGTLVAVIGAGTIGLLISHLAIRAGALVVAVDIAADRRRLAARAGAISAEPVVAQDVVMDHSDGRGADVVFECSGAGPGVLDAVVLTRRGGRTVLVGVSDGAVTVPHADIVIGEKHLIGTASHLWDEDMVTAVRLLERGAITEDDLSVRVTTLDLAATALLRPDRTAVKTAVRLTVPPPV